MRSKALQYYNPDPLTNLIIALYCNCNLRNTSILSELFVSSCTQGDMMKA